MASSDKLAMPLAIAAYSAARNLKGRSANLIILDGGITQASKRKILQTIATERLHVYWVNPQSARLAAIGQKNADLRYPMAAYYRLLLPEILPETIKKVIYLDSDLIVLSDVGDLWDMELGNNHFLAVQEPDGPYLIESLRSNNPELRNLDLTTFGITPEHKHCNSGVMVINLQLWRRDKVIDKTLDFVESYMPKFADQEAINIVLAGKWKSLDPRWNVTPAFYKEQPNSPYTPEVVSRVLSDPFILHFAGIAKPWVVGQTARPHPRAKLFYEYAARTPWGWSIRRDYWLNQAWQKTSALKHLPARFLRKAGLLNGANYRSQTDSQPAESELVGNKSE